MSSLFDPFSARKLLDLELDLRSRRRARLRQLGDAGFAGGQSRQRRRAIRVATELVAASLRAGIVGRRRSRAPVATAR